MTHPTHSKRPHEQQQQGLMKRPRDNTTGSEETKQRDKRKLGYGRVWKRNQQNRIMRHTKRKRKRKQRNATLNYRTKHHTKDNGVIARCDTFVVRGDNKEREQNRCTYDSKFWNEKVTWPTSTNGMDDDRTKWRGKLIGNLIMETAQSTNAITEQTTTQTRERIVCQHQHEEQQQRPESTSKWKVMEQTTKKRPQTTEPTHRLGRNWKPTKQNPNGMMKGWNLKTENWTLNWRSKECSETAWHTTHYSSLHKRENPSSWMQTKWTIIEQHGGAWWLATWLWNTETTTTTTCTPHTATLTQTHKHTHNTARHKNNNVVRSPTWRQTRINKTETNVWKNNYGKSWRRTTHRYDRKKSCNSGQRTTKRTITEQNTGAR